MATSAEECELRTMEVLQHLRADFRRVLAVREQGAHKFRAFGAELYVDQCRELVADGTGYPDAWVFREGKWTISTSSELDQGVLALVVGSNRFLSAEQVFLAIADLLTDRRCRLASSAAELTNLLVVEGALFPSHEAPLLATIAWCLESSTAQTDLYEGLPNLMTEFDRFYEQLPVDARYAKKLRPRRVSGDWEAYERELVERLRPTVEGGVPRSGQEREALLRQYTRDHLFARMAGAIDAAAGTYVQIPRG